MARPSLYDPDYHPKDLVKKMSKGKLNNFVFASWGISKKTFYSWIKEHPELAEAYEIGQTACDSWWDERFIKKADDGDTKGFKYDQLIAEGRLGMRKDSAGVTNNTINVNGDINLLANKSVKELDEIFQDRLLKLGQYTSVTQDESVIDVEVTDVGQESANRSD